MITRRITATVLVTVILLGVGLALGNGPLIAIGLTVGGYTTWALGSVPTGRGTIAVDLDRQHPRVGDVFTISVHATCAAGHGPYLLHQPLPPSLQLVEGHNIALGWKRRRTGRRTLRFRVRCATRGRFAIPPPRLVGLDVLGVRAARVETHGTAKEILVAPRVRAVPRVKRHRGRARVPQAAGDVARAGDRGSEFHELRDYVAGDPLHAVNWRATARRSTDRLELMVNEHEPEGKKSVWLFLDAGAHMEVGHADDNSLDGAIEGALGLLEHYGRRGHRLGLTIYHQPETHVLYPDVGSRQMSRVTKLLSQLTAHDGGDGLGRAVLRTRGFLARERPLVILVTRPEAEPEDTRDGIDQLRRIIGTGSRAPPIQLVAPAPVRQGITGGHHPLAVQTAQAVARGMYAHLRRRGVRVIDWDPGAEPLEALLVREVAGR